MMILYRIYQHIVIAVFAVSSICAFTPDGFAQTNTPQQKAEQSQQGAPADLPDIIIKGSATLNLLDRTLAKQTPRNTPRISARELDSLNTLEKQSPLLLATLEYPRTLISRVQNRGYARAEFGMFTTPELEFGYGDTYAGYTLFGSGHFSTSAGHLDNAGFTRAGADITARYIAPERYILFGGSQTTTSLSLAHNDYKLFASPEALGRNHTRFSGAVDVTGESAGIPFTAGVSAQTLIFSQQRAGGSRDFSESGLQGYASVQSSWSGVSVGVKGTTDLRNYDSRAVNFHQLFGTASYLDSLHTFMLRLGVQAGHSSNNATHAAFLFNPKYSLTLTPSLRLHAELFSGLENASFAEFLRINPYVSDSSVVSFARTSIKGVVGVTYQPSVSLTTRFDLSYSSAGNTPVLIADSGFAFNPIYIEAQLVMMNLDLRYLLSDNDALSTTLRYTSATSGGAHVPYIAPIVWSFRYDRTVLRSLTLSLLSDYVSARRTQFAVTDEVQSYFNLSIRGEYSLSPSFSAYLRFDNLLNSSIFVWQGYRERGAFAAGGVRWMFN